MSKYLCIVGEPVVEGGLETRLQRTTVRIPLALIRAGMKLRTLIPSDAAASLSCVLRDQGIDPDIHKLMAGALEQLVDTPNALEVAIIQGGKEKVRIYIE